MRTALLGMTLAALFSVSPAMAFEYTINECQGGKLRYLVIPQYTKEGYLKRSVTLVPNCYLPEGLSATETTFVVSAPLTPDRQGAERPEFQSLEKALELVYWLPNQGQE